MFINLLSYLYTENFPMEYMNVSFKHQTLFKNVILEKNIPFI